jgi:hypothetical protein
VRWSRSNPLTFHSVAVGVEQILQPLFEKYGVLPTYLISPEVLNDEASVTVLRRIEHCELGTHLHAEYIGPGIKFVDPAGTLSDQYPCTLGAEIESAKIRSITRLFESRFGHRPLSYRAARFGANKNTFSALVQNGYKVDTSVTPGIDWRKQGGPDHRKYLRHMNLIEHDLLEIPVTIGRKRLPFLPERWYYYRWMRPSIMTSMEMKRLVDEVENQSDGTICINMMFHTMEVIPGASPYVKTRSDQAKFLSRLEKTITHILNSGYESKTLIQIYNSYVPRSIQPEPAKIPALTS